jgi:Fe-S cluster biogenesis protein NfuA
MTAPLADGIDRAIEGLRPSFSADNFEIGLESLTAGEAVVAITMGEGACADCLIPEPMLTQIVDAAIRREAPGVASVTVVKHGFGG